MSKALVWCAAAALAAAGSAAAQVNTGEAYNVTFFGSGGGGSVFASPWANTVVSFDGASEAAIGQPGNIFAQPVGSAISYDISESVIDNGDGSWTIRVTASTGSNAGFLAAGLDFDPFSPGSQPLDTFTFDLGATTFGTNNGIRAASNDFSLVSANISWLDDGGVFLSEDALERFQISMDAGVNALGSGGGLRGQFSVSSPGEDLFAIGNGIDTVVLDIVVVPAPTAGAVFGLGGLLVLRRRRHA